MSKCSVNYFLKCQTLCKQRCFLVKLCANYLCCALAGTASLTISESCSGCRRGCGAAPGGKSQISASPIIRARWSLKSEFALPSAAARTGMILGLFVDVWQADCVSHLEFLCLRRSEMFAKALPHPGHKRVSLRPWRGSGIRRMEGKRKKGNAWLRNRETSSDMFSRCARCTHLFLQKHQMHVF